MDEQVLNHVTQAVPVMGAHSSKKPYRAPELVKWGAMTDLTKGAECGNGDGMETGDDECTT